VERLECLLDGIDAAFVHFGGVPRRVVLDNTSLVREWERLSARAVEQRQVPQDLLADAAAFEVAQRRERRIQRRMYDAHFPLLKTLDGLDFAAQPGLDREGVLALFRSDFAREARNVARLYERRSLVVTTNLPFTPWSEVFFDATTAVIDRIVHHATVLQTEGSSFRLRAAKERPARKRKEVAGPRRPPGRPAYGRSAPCRGAPRTNTKGGLFSESREGPLLSCRPHLRHVLRLRYHLGCRRSPPVEARFHRGDQPAPPAERPPELEAGARRQPRGATPQEQALSESFERRHTVLETAAQQAAKAAQRRMRASRRWYYGKGRRG
jgi:hypothetical protein